MLEWLTVAKSKTCFDATVYDKHAYTMSQNHFKYDKAIKLLVRQSLLLRDNFKDK